MKRFAWALAVGVGLFGLVETASAQYVIVNPGPVAYAPRYQSYPSYPSYGYGGGYHQPSHQSYGHHHHGYGSGYGYGRPSYGYGSGYGSGYNSGYGRSGLSFGFAIR